MENSPNTKLDGNSDTRGIISSGAVAAESVGSIGRAEDETREIGALNGASARNLGRAALGPAEGDIAGRGITESGRPVGVDAEARIISSDDAIKEMVARENGYAEAGNLTPGENVVGGESKLQIAQREANEQETAKVESGVDLPEDQAWLHEIAEASDKEMGETVQHETGKMMAGVDPKIRVIEDLRFKAMVAASRKNGNVSYGSGN